MSPIQQAAALPLATQASSERLLLQRSSQKSSKATSQHRGEALDRPDAPYARAGQRDEGYFWVPGAGTSHTARGEEQRGDA